MNGKQKFVLLMKNMQKLTPARQKFWLDKLKAVRNTPSKELGAEPTSQANKDWLLDTANWFDKVYSSAADTLKKGAANVSGVDLLYANQLDKIYNTVADEVAKVPETTGKAFQKLTGDNFWPYLIGGGVVLAAVLYLKR